MIKKLFLIIPLAFSLNAKAHNVCIADTIRVRTPKDFTNSFRMLEPTYLTDVVSASAWRNNWFVNLSGGASAFIGSPLGCEDLFGRIKPAIGISAGKWFTPTVGSRISYQGWQLKDAELRNQKYMNFHADLLVNLSSYWYNSRDRPHYDIVPYVGLGLLHNEDNGNNPFAFSYGVMGRYSLTPRLHLTMELGGTTTFRNFDGHGDSRELGDNLLDLTAGLSFTIGKAGWKRVVDATPYMLQNKWLSEYATTMEQRHQDLLKKYQSNVRAVAELKKILEIEGLLEKYESCLSDDGWPPAYNNPENDYSGLNSLRKRLHENAMGMGKNGVSSGKSHEDGTGKQPVPVMADSIVSIDQYINGMLAGDICIGSPIHFFFVLGTAELTDRSQLVNVDEIARLVNRYGLSVHVTGTADSATGNEDINAGLGTDRAKYISTELTQRGVSPDRIRLCSKGGINVYRPNEANRQVRVELYFP